MIRVEIGGVDRTSLVEPGSLRVPDRIGERSEASFLLKTAAGGIHPLPLDPVVIWDDAVKLFQGFMWDPEEEKLSLRPGSGVLVSCKVVDNHLLADRRVVVDSYDNMNAGAIVTDLMTQFLADDGVTVGVIEDGPIISRAVFNYPSFSKAMDELCEVAGFYWYIDADKKLYFRSRASNAAPWAVTDASPIRSVRVRRHREQYRNRQFLRAGVDTTDPQTEKFRGDGANRNFTLVYPVASKPTSVKVYYNFYDASGVPEIPAPAGTVRTLGIRGLEEGFDFYWSKGENNLSQDAAGGVLTNRDLLEVVYRGLFNVAVEQMASEEIAARKLAEGGTGIYDAVDEVHDLDTIDAARQYADGKLRRYARLDGSISFETEQPGLKAGQLLTVTLSDHGIAGETFLIEEVTFEDFGRDNDSEYRYTVRAVSGDEVGGWVQFFKRLAGKSFSIREDEVLVKMKSLTEGVTISDTLSITKASPYGTAGFATVGFAEAS